jgi:hypothetical protein
MCPNNCHILAIRTPSGRRGVPCGHKWPRRATVFAEGRTIERGFYVQVRYPHAERWDTVAVSATRGVAAQLAGGMYRDLRNAAGQSPGQVRIASDDLLRREGGDVAVQRAAADLWRRAQAASRGEA